jgi:hypothetical protein
VGADGEEGHRSGYHRRHQMSHRCLQNHSHNIFLRYSRSVSSGPAGPS